MDQRQTSKENIPANAAGDIALPLEIRLHGRGGQGGVTCTKLIAAVYAQMGLNVQTFGEYGAERSGAPVRAFTRVDRLPIKNRNKVYRPDHLLVLDEALLGPLVLDGVAPGALILLNSAARPERFFQQFAAYRFGVVDATGIARKHGIGTRSVVIINTTIVGGYLKLVGLPLEMLKNIYAALGLTGDMEAANEAYREVRFHDPAAVKGPVREVELETTLPPVKPMTEHFEDIPVQLKTGNWSTRQPVYKDFVAPCNNACPAGNDVVGFIQALNASGAEAAAKILLRTQALPAVCGRVCPAYCMRECNRKHLDGSVNIRSLERWISDHCEILPKAEKAEKILSVAIIGGGPAGLSAAYQVAGRGHRATVYEKEEKLGGVLRYGIPAYRLPEDVLERDIERIFSLGIVAECGHPIDRAEMGRLRRLYDAVIVCIGSGDARILSAPGSDLGGIEQGLHFLHRSRKKGLEAALFGDVVVVGGGNTAIDCARSALRRGAASVKLVYRRSRKEMPAIEEEIEDAIREGVQLIPFHQPVAFRGVDCVTGVVLAEVELGDPDPDGRRAPTVTERTIEIDCNKVLLALGQTNEMGLLPVDWQIRDARARLAENPINIWFAGDCSTADGTVAHAVGNGRRVALAALAGLGATNAEETQIAKGLLVAPSHIRFQYFPILAPNRDRHLVIDGFRDNFEEVNLGLSGPEEAERCFSCGRCTHCDTCVVYCPDGVIYRTGNGYRVDETYCKGCGICVAECPRKAMEFQPKAECT